MMFSYGLICRISKNRIDISKTVDNLKELSATGKPLLVCKIKEIHNGDALVRLPTGTNLRASQRAS